MEKFPELSSEQIDKNYQSLKLLKEGKIDWKFKTNSKSYIEILREDLTNLKIDVVVNAAQELLTGGGGVDEAIHKKAGPDLNEEIIKTIPIKSYGGRILTGEAILTKGHNLPAKFIIHTVAPYLDDKGNTQPELLRECYRNALKIVSDNNFKSVAFPALGTGFYGYPIMEATQIAFEECLNFLDHKEDQKPKIMFCFITDLHYNISKELYDKYITLK